MATICGAFSRKVVQASVAVIVSPYSTAAAGACETDQGGGKRRGEGIGKLAPELAPNYSGRGGDQPG
jgi:hypothetical protein